VGLGGFPPGQPPRLALDPPPSEQARRAFAAEVREAHCGMAPDAMVDAMIDAQRARDATLAGALLAAGAADGAVLIAGAGHVRRDRGVPLYFERRAPERSVLALAFREVERGSDGADTDPTARVSGTGAEFDLVWFTPRVDDQDPCERFRRDLERLRRPAADSHPKSPSG
jgi:hypothetical protein